VIEMNISLLGSPYAGIKVADKELQIRSTATHKNINKFSLEDKFLNLAADFSFNEDINLWHYPVETISLSEDGIERLYQGTAFLFVFDLEMQDRKKLWLKLNFGEDNK